MDETARADQPADPDSDNQPDAGEPGGIAEPAPEPVGTDNNGD